MEEKRGRRLQKWIVGIICFSVLLGIASPLLAQDKTEIVMMQFGPTQKRRESMDKAVVIFESRFPNIDVTIDRAGWVEQREKFLASIMAGAPCCDGMVNCGGYTGEFCYLGAMEPLESYITLDLYNSIPKGYWDVVTYEGHTYGLPPYFCVTGVFYNVDQFKEVGLVAPPREFDEFLPAMQKLTRDVNGDGKIDQYGYGAPGGAWLAHIAPSWMFIFDKDAGYWKIQADGKRKAAFNTPKAKAGFKYFVELTTKYKVTPSPEAWISAGWQEAIRAFDMGITSTYHHLNWLGWQMEKVNWGVVPQPKGPDGTTTWSEASNYSMMITKGSEHKEEAWKFIHFLASDDDVIEMRVETVGQLPVQTRLLDKFAAKGPRWKQMVDCLVDNPTERYRIYPLEPGFETSMEETLSALERSYLVTGARPEKAVEEWSGFIQEDLDEIYQQ